MSHAVLTSAQIQYDLTRIDQLIADLDRSGPEQVGRDLSAVLQEHLQSARAYLPAGMPDEYSLSLESIQTQAASIPDAVLREKVLTTVTDLTRELARNDDDRGAPGKRHSPPKAEGDTPENAKSPLWRFFNSSDISFGVFYPKRHIVAVFPTLALAKQAAGSLVETEFPPDEVAIASGPEMKTFLDELRDSRGIWGTLMERLSRGFATEEAFVDKDKKKAEEGAAFLMVYSPGEAETERARSLMRPFHPTAMQWYLGEGIHSLI